jgi:hypothetical protein
LFPVPRAPVRGAEPGHDFEQARDVLGLSWHGSRSRIRRH